MSRLDELLKKLLEATTTGAIARYPTPFKVKNSFKPKRSNNKGMFSPPTAFTWNPDKNGWDLDDDEDIMWSPWGHPGEAVKPAKYKDVGQFAYLTRRGRLAGRERAV